MESFQLPKSVLIAFIREDNYYLLQEDVKVLPQASYSTIQTISAFLCYNFPDLDPPGYPESPKIIQDNSYPSKYLSINYNFEPWCSYLTTIPEQSSQIRISKYNEQVCFLCKTQENFHKKLEQKNHAKKLFIIKSSNEALEDDLYKSHMKIKPQKKLIGLMDLTNFQFETDIYKPTGHIISIYQGIWFQQGDFWKKYNILKGDIPQPEELSKFHGIFLSGSACSVNDQKQNILKLSKNLKIAMQMNKSLKVVGICFGHQMITKIFDGIVQKKHFISSVQKITLNPEKIQKYPQIQAFLGQKEYLFSQIHSDYVTKIEDCFEILGSSSSCDNQIMIAKDSKRFLSFQFHPELSSEYLIAVRGRVRTYNQTGNVFGLDNFNTIYVDSKEGQQCHRKSLQLVRVAIRNFLDSNSTTS